jgi:hypothetical protein
VAIECGGRTLRCAKRSCGPRWEIAAADSRAPSGRRRSCSGSAWRLSLSLRGRIGCSQRPRVRRGARPVVADQAREGRRLGAGSPARRASAIRRQVPPRPLDCGSTPGVPPAPELRAVSGLDLFWKESVAAVIDGGESSSPPRPHAAAWRLTAPLDGSRFGHGASGRTQPQEMDLGAARQAFSA